MLARLHRFSATRLSLLAATLLAVTGVLDWVTGPELAASILYLLPITLMAWFVGRGPGLVTAVASGLVWLSVELSTHTLSNPIIPFWNGAVRSAVFCVVGFSVSEVARRTKELRVLNESLEQRVAERGAALRHQTDLLESILNSMGEGVVVADATGRVVTFNPAAEQILRLAPDGPAFRRWLEARDDFLTDEPTAPPPHGHPLLRAVRGESSDGVETFLRHDSQPEGVWLALTGRPLVDAAGQRRGGVIVFSDVTDRKTLERQVAEISEREQRRLGEDLHDGLCQHLVSTAFAMKMLQDRLAHRPGPEADDAAKIVGLLNDAITQARDVARGLYLLRLELDGLHGALEELAAQVRARHKIRCHYDGHVPVPVDDPVVARELFRIAQEAVANALKHAHPTRLTLTLDADEQRVLLRIANDGRAFRAPDAASRPSGMGLHIMNHRARVIGAVLNIEAGTPDGAVVSCIMPRWVPQSPLRP